MYHDNNSCSSIRCFPSFGCSGGLIETGSDTKHQQSTEKRSSSVESSAPTATSAYSMGPLPTALAKQLSSVSTPALSSDVTAPLKAAQDSSSNLIRPQKDVMSLWDSLGPLYLDTLLPVIRAGHKFHRKRKKMVRP